MPKLQVVIASTRPGRIGEPVARWVVDRAKAHGKFDVELVDLREINLPLLDEPKHPRLQQYEHAHTKAWSEKVKSADAFVFVIPEYNFSMPPALVNALDYLFHEWHYKAVGLVSYGGVSAGLRSAQMAKQLITAVKMMPLPEAVSIPFVNNFIENSVFKGDAKQDDAAKLMLDELAKWTGALMTLRKPS